MIVPEIKTKKNKILAVIALIIISILLVSCKAAQGEEESMNNEFDFDADKQVVVIEMEKGGIIKLEMYPDNAPITVENFVTLIRDGFYDGLIFHRVVEGFMIQGGDPQGTGMGGSSQKIKGEFKENGVDNNIEHERGVISMARSMDPNSASSQFFIMHANSTHLDGKYAGFGKVIEGMDIVDQIANVDCDFSNPQSPRPLTPQVIKEMRIENRG